MGEHYTSNRAMSMQEDLGFVWTTLLPMLGWSIVFYYAYLFIGYIFHRVVHCPQSGPCYTVHMRHHLQEYPPTALLSDTYRGERHEFHYKIPLAMMPLFVGWMLFPFDVAILFTVELSFLSAASQYLHERYHLKDPGWLATNPLTRRLFRQWQRQHFIHHRDTTSNLTIGCADITPDLVFGTAST
ncbi:TFIIH basal transcription factor complex helicase XPB subunit [Balamuthia mandrillaris]